MLLAILGGVVALAMAGLVARQARYYGRLFSDAHFREIYDAFVPVVGSGGRFVTSAGLAIVVSRTETNDRQQLHVSLSQAARVTTSAVAGRIGFFVVTILNRNKLSLDPFFTGSRVHHLAFAFPAGTPLEINDFDAVMQHYRRDYRPLPYELRALD